MKSIRIKKNRNALIIRKHVIWAKATNPSFLINDEELPFDLPIKANPNSHTGFYTPSNPIYTIPQFDDEEIEFLQSFLANNGGDFNFEDEEVLI